MSGSVLFAGLCDDAAVFPPGSLSLEEAVPAHAAHRRAPHHALVGPLVVASRDLQALGTVLAEPTIGRDVTSLDLSLVAPLGQAAQAYAAAAALAKVRCVSVEIAVGDQVAPADLVPALEDAAAGWPATVIVYVEVPRDTRRAATLDALAGTPYGAKLRTGGVRAELYPDEPELAGSLLGAVRAGVAFKATAGLHHALRNTDPTTGFEQHGFLNVLAATGAALDGADEGDLVALLAERDPALVAGLVRGLSGRVRESFRSFGTCSVTDPADDLVRLGLLALDPISQELSCPA